MLRYVPFAAVASANCVNIPLMRQNELTQGVDVVDDDNIIVGKSRVAAVKGISEVVFCRILMAAPGMLLLPILMERLERINWFKRLQFLHAPFQVLAVGGFLIFMVPAACSVFPQRCSLNMSTIQRFESEFYEEMQKKHGKKLPEIVYFNKGL